MHFRKEFLPYLIIVGVAFVILFGLFYLSFFGNKTQQTTPRPSASQRVRFSPTPQDIDKENLQYHPDSSTKVQFIDEASQKIMDQSAAVGNLLPKLPHKGTFFTLEYSYQTNSFTVTFIGNSSQANQEFDQFLKQNKIENRNWLYNLNIAQ